MPDFIVSPIWDAIARLKPAQLVHSSPPYYGKRRYKIRDIVLGGDPNCAHDFSTPHAPPRPRKASEHGKYGVKLVSGQKFDAVDSHTCRLCGAWKGQLGQEPNPDMFARHLADIFAAIPLREDGIIAVNLMDSHISGKGKSGRADESKGAARLAAGETITAAHSNIGGKGITCPLDDRAMMRAAGLKPKSKAMVPERFALAMIERGFIYRMRIIWRKLNPLPESVRDRLPTTYEDIMVFAKNANAYFDRNAIQIPCAQSTIRRYKDGISGSGKYARNDDIRQNIANARPGANDGDEGWWGRETKSLSDVWDISTAGHRSKIGDHVAPMPLEIPKRFIQQATRPGDMVTDPFAGTGTTGVAATLLGRESQLVDMDERMEDFYNEHLVRQKATAPLLEAK